MRATFRTQVRAEVDGLSLSGYADQHGAYLRQLRDEGKESFALELFQAAVRPGAVVVDGGAYVGHYTLVAARAAGASGRVFSFEPHPRTFQCLQRNLRENGFTDRVYARRECLAEMAGLGSFHLARGDGSKSSVCVPRAPAGSRVAVYTTLDDALGRVPSVDVMKLGLEGGEVQALRGMRWTLARSRAVRLFVEYNPQALHRAHLSRDHLLGALDDAGFTVEVIDETRRRLAPLGELDELAADADHVNLYCRGPEAA